MPRLALPGWDWVPPVLRHASYWRVVARFALWGPLIGGAPYAVFVVTLPFIYLIGLAPAVIAGLLFAAWLHAPGRHPDAAWRAAVGALCGALACAAVAWAIDARAPWQPWAWLTLHGVPAATLLALRQRAPSIPAAGARAHGLYRPWPGAPLAAKAEQRSSNEPPCPRA